MQPENKLPMIQQSSSPGAAPSGLCCPTETDGEADSPRLEQPFVAGVVQTPAGELPRVSSDLTWADRLGSSKARWGVGRMRYTLDPGLYALGNPDQDAPVLVTANYKMSFDRLRKALPGLSAWILVLDTNGINVWCAAGKKTFGTQELVDRVRRSSLDRIVSHKQLIVPQLGGPGVSAHRVKKASGFKVIYGPIRAEDLPAFLNRGMKALPEMRRKNFSLRERVVLIPVELVSALKAVLVAVLAMALFSGLLGSGPFLQEALQHGMLALFAMLGAVTAGAVLTPLCLPWLPGRPFSVKGSWVGLVAAAVLLFSRWEPSSSPAYRLETWAWVLMVLALTSFLAMSFTGASTYTSLSGVKKEMRWAVPVQIAVGFAGLCLWIGSNVTV